MPERHYLPTFAELADRLSIVLLKMIFIPENREAYCEERQQIEHDLEIMLRVARNFRAIDIRALLMLMLSNRYIWENEFKLRAGTKLEAAVAADVLRATHSINGVRNHAKNILANRFGERVDLKVDCLAADLPKDFGNWDVF